MSANEVVRRKSSPRLCASRQVFGEQLGIIETRGSHTRVLSCRVSIAPTDQLELSLGQQLPCDPCEIITVCPAQSHLSPPGLAGMTTFFPTGLVPGKHIGIMDHRPSRRWLQQSLGMHELFQERQYGRTLSRRSCW